MIRQRALSLLTVLALLWQGAVSAAMAPSMALAMSPPAAIAAPSEVPAAMAMPCHDMPGMRHHDAAPDPLPAKAAVSMTCCDTSGHCLCAAACGAAMLPMPLLDLALLPQASLHASMPASAPAAAPPPHPFRPPIAAPAI